MVVDIRRALNAVDDGALALGDDREIADGEDVGELVPAAAGPRGWAGAAIARRASAPRVAAIRVRSPGATQRVGHAAVEDQARRRRNEVRAILGQFVGGLAVP